MWIKSSLIIMMVFLMSCEHTKVNKSGESSTIQNIPAIVKALEAIGEVSKSKVDKSEK